MARLTLNKLTVLAVAAVALIGCGGGGGGAATTGGGGGGGGTTLAAALEALRAGMRSGNPTLADLTALKASFDAAVTADPTSADARTGAAIVNAAVASRKILDVYGANVDDATLNNRSFPLIDSAIRLKLPNIASGDYAPTAAPIAVELLPRLVPMMGQPSQENRSDPTIWFLAGVASSAQSEVDLAIASLLAISNSAPATVVGDPSPDGAETSSNATASFGEVERKALLTQLRALRIATGVLDAYRYDLGAFTESSFALTVYGAQFANATPIAPATYAPVGTFLTLKPGGGTLLATVKGQFALVRDNGKSFADAIAARTGGDNIVSSANFSSGLLDALRSELDTFKTFADGPVAVPNFPFLATPADEFALVRIDLNQLFSAPPADFKVFLPGLEPSSDTVDVGFLGIEPNPALDRTLGGIFPDGLDSNAYFDRFTDVDPTWTLGNVLNFGMRILF